MSKEQSQPVREVVPFKNGKRQSTFRRINIDFAGTALEQALAEKERLEKASHQVSIGNPPPETITDNGPVDVSETSSNTSPLDTPAATTAATPPVGVDSVLFVLPEKRVVSDLNSPALEAQATHPTEEQNQNIVDGSTVNPLIATQPSKPKPPPYSKLPSKDVRDSSAPQEVKSNDVQILLPSTFEQLELRWKAVLRRAELSVLKALYEMIYAQGLTELLTSPAQISVRAGIDKRHCQRVIAKFEMLGLVEKGETYNTKTKKGTVYHLHLVPHFSPSPSPRIFHFEDENLPADE